MAKDKKKSSTKGITPKPTQASEPTPAQKFNWPPILVSTSAVILTIITIVTKFNDIIEWPIPKKMLALVIALLLWLALEIYFRMGKKYGKGDKTILRLGMVGFFAIVGFTFGYNGIIACCFPTPTITPTLTVTSTLTVTFTPSATIESVSRKYYYMLVIDATEDMNSSLADRTPKWKEALVSAQDTLQYLDPSSNYGLVLIGGQQKYDNNDSDQCDRPSAPVIPIGRLENNTPIIYSPLSKDAVLNNITQQSPSGGGSFMQALSVASDQLRLLPEDKIKTIIFITGAKDTCIKNEWVEIKKQFIELNAGIQYLEILVVDESTAPGDILQIEEKNTPDLISEKTKVKFQVCHDHEECAQAVLNIKKRFDVYFPRVASAATANPQESQPNHTPNPPNIPTPTITWIPTITFTPTATSTRTLIFNPPTNTPTVSPPPYATPTNTPTIPAPPPPSPTHPPESFTLISLTSPVSRGQDATVQIQTVAGASCFLSYITPAGTVSGATGLGPTTADSSGICSWTWHIGTNTTPGTGMLDITANGETKLFDIIIQ